MSTYKVIDGVLHIRKVDIPKIQMNPMSCIQQSYCEFLEEKFYGCIKHMEELLRKNPELSTLVITPTLKNLVKRDYLKTQTRNGSYYYPVFCTFTVNGQPAGPVGDDGWEVLRIPFMDDYGHVNIEGKDKVVLNLQRPMEGCSYNKHDEYFNLALPARNIRIYGTAKKVSIRFGSERLDAAKILQAMMYEADDNTKLDELFTNTHLIKALNVESPSIPAQVYSHLMSTNPNNFIETLKTPEYSLGKARVSLNKVCTMNRGIGCELSRQVLDYPERTKVTQEIIHDFIRHGLNHYHVFCADVPENYVLAGNHVIFNSLPAGFPNSAYLRSRFPKYAKYNNLPEDITPENNNGQPAIFIPMGTLVDKVLVEFLIDCGYRQLHVAPAKGKTPIVLSFEREIIGNYTAALGDLVDNIPDGRYADEMVYYYNNPTFAKVNHDHLTCHDLMAILSIIGQSLLLGDSGLLDMDNAYLKKIMLIGDVFEETLNKAIEHFVKTYRRPIINNVLCTKRGEPNNPFIGLTKEWYHVFNEDGVTAPADTLNLAAEVSQVNHVCSVTSNQSEITDVQRHIATPFFGRICLYETPAGKKLGVVNTRALGVRYNEGVAEIPVYRVLHMEGCVGVNTNQVYWLNQEEELNYKLGDIMSLDLRPGKVPGTYLMTDKPILARVPSLNDSTEPFKFQNIRSVDLAGHFVTAYPEQFLSTTAALIPFACCDDPVRISYGLSQLRQAIYLLNSQKPRVRTPMYEDILGYSGTAQFFASTTGTVTFVNNRKCVIQDIEGEKHTVYMQGSGHLGQLDATMDIMVKVGQHVNSGDLIGEAFKYPQTFVVRAPFDGYIYDVKDTYIMISRSQSHWVNFEDGFDMISMSNYRITGNSVVLLNIRVSKGDHVVKGQILADTYASRDGVYSPSRNALVGYISTGYNYEDGVHATELAAINYTSISTHKITQSVSLEKFPHVRASAENGFKYCGDGDVCMKLKCRKNGLDKIPDVEIPVRATLKAHGIAFECLRSETTKTSCEYECHLLGLKKLNVGDKMTGRHGNKGVVSKISPDSEAPQLANGRTLEFMLNPCGVPSRMNLGQIDDAHMGLVAEVLNQEINVEAFNSASPDDVAYMLSYTYDLANTLEIGDNLTHTYNRAAFDAVCRKYSMLPQEFHELVWPNIERIIDWRGVFDRYGDAINVYDPITDTFFDGKITIGVPMFNKQEQESDEKINFRGGALTESYSRNTAQPQKGPNSAKGQRMGEMELVDLASYGASAILEEDLNEKCDNTGLRAFRHLDQMGVSYDSSFIEDTSRAVENLCYMLEGVGAVLEVPEEVGNLSRNASIRKSNINVKKALLYDSSLHSHESNARIQERRDDFDDMGD